MGGDTFRMAYRVGVPEVWAVADMHKPGVLFVPVHLQPTRAALVDAAVEALARGAAEDAEVAMQTHFVMSSRPGPMLCPMPLFLNLPRRLRPVDGERWARMSAGRMLGMGR